MMVPINLSLWAVSWISQIKACVTTVFLCKCFYYTKVCSSSRWNWLRARWRRDFICPVRYKGLSKFIFPFLFNTTDKQVFARSVFIFVTMSWTALGALALWTDQGMSILGSGSCTSPLKKVVQTLQYSWISFVYTPTLRGPPNRV